jgi:hypothetical protein
MRPAGEILAGLFHGPFPDSDVSLSRPHCPGPFPQTLQGRGFFIQFGARVVQPYASS